MMPVIAIDECTHSPKNVCICETRMPLLHPSPKLAFLSIKVMVNGRQQNPKFAFFSIKVKVTSSLPLVPFERVLLVEWACQT